jgi:hypothetical protein
MTEPTKPPNGWCKKCKTYQPVSNAFCPKCGLADPVNAVLITPAMERKSNIIALIVMSIPIIAVVLLLFYMRSCFNESRREAANRPDLVGAYTACEYFVKERLKAPRSAKFPWYNESMVRYNGSTYTVQSYVDAQNSFGAQLRMNFICSVTPSGESWKLVDIQMRSR